MNRTLYLLLFLFVTGCQTIFPLSPYTASISDEFRDTNQENLLRIRPEVFTPNQFVYNGEDAVAVALISDTHFWYDETVDVVDALNSDTSISMTFHGGDISEGGLPKEFTEVARKMKGINTPSFAIIGNHDYLAMGKNYYQEVFGIPEGTCKRGTSYTVTLNSEIATVRIIMFDNTVWEAGNSRPDFEWLDRECRKASDQTDRTIVIAHIPPWDQQLSQGYGWEYNAILEKYAVPLSVHGHLHHGVDDQTYQEHFANSSVKYAIIGSTRQHGYARIVFTRNATEFELVRL